ncbi:origin of replication complex subunit 5 [Canna indica]|uniref:Origin of replication complex subunit 5 n=1 Tax=Canna indica TaxID=4628 RepID=A0AAQ3KVS3_9LILI|nr:origin of replication complex subunit 5 [Canna indica]
MAGVENAPQTPARRITRSLSATPSKPPHGTSNPPPPATPTAAPSWSDDLALPQETVSLDDLFALLPGRRSQILELLRVIGPPNSPMLPALLCGGPSTGKTSTVLHVFRHLRRRFVYTSCRSCYCPRILFETVLNQLLRHTKKRENGYSSAKKCDKASDFVYMLGDALVQAKSAIRGEKKKSCSKEGQHDGNSEMVYLIFDNVELIRSWDKGSTILPLLFRIPDLLKIPDVGLIYISRAMPATYYTMTGSLEPVYIHFTDYTLADLQCMLMRNQVNEKLYSSFLSVVLKPFYRVTRRVDELAIALKPLFKKYCEPLKDLKLVPDEGMKRRLFDYLQPHLTASLNEIFEIPPWASVEAKNEGISSKRGNIRKSWGKDVYNELDIHMPISAKYLLISGFLASRNPATLDASLFDSTGGSSNSKRKRKSIKTSLDKQEDIAEEILMKGPGSFPLERLLAIYQCITSVMECAAEDHEDGIQPEGLSVHLMSDVLLQLSTLCNANFICKSNSCPLEGSARYRSTIDEDMALKVARSINFPLSKYIYRR